MYRRNFWFRCFAIFRSGQCLSTASDRGSQAVRIRVFSSATLLMPEWLAGLLGIGEISLTFSTSFWARMRRRLSPKTFGSTVIRESRANDIDAVRDRPSSVITKTVDSVPTSRISSRKNSKMGITEWVVDGDVLVTNIKTVR